jgi:hypothetical protein
LGQQRDAIVPQLSFPVTAYLPHPVMQVGDVPSVMQVVVAGVVP